MNVGGTRYPQVPGYKAGDTSKAAAAGIAAHAATVRAEVLAEFVAVHPKGLTADQTANRINESILTVRPRVSELRAAGLLEPTTETAMNSASGHQARVWRATAKAMEAAHD